MPLPIALLLQLTAEFIKLVVDSVVTVVLYSLEVVSASESER
jgi:hypothetical protein